MEFQAHNIHQTGAYKATQTFYASGTGKKTFGPGQAEEATRSSLAKIPGPAQRVKPKVRLPKDSEYHFHHFILFSIVKLLQTSCGLKKGYDARRRPRD